MLISLVLVNNNVFFFILRHIFNTSTLFGCLMCLFEPDQNITVGTRLILYKFCFLYAVSKLLTALWMDIKVFLGQFNVDIKNILKKTKSSWCSK